MIANKTEKDPIILAFEQCAFAIHLGGSRRMNQLYPDLIPITESTDYDWYVTDSPHVTDFLLRLGFKISRYGVDPYLDDEAIVILKTPDDKHQVVIRYDAVFYQNVFENIDPWFYGEYLWKSNPQRIAAVYDQGHIGPIFNQLFKIAKNA